MTTESEETGQNFFEQVIKIWILPEIHRRQDAGELEGPLELCRAQVLFRPGKSPEVRVNEEVITGEVRLGLKQAMSFKQGDIVYMKDVAGIKEVKLAEEEEDFGHITLIAIGDKWHIYFDTRYNKRIGKEHLDTANQFVECAEFALERRYLAPYFDLLYSATELAAKAMMLSNIRPEMQPKEKHGEVKKGFRQLAEIGLLEREYFDTYSQLLRLRNSYRYLHQDFHVDQEEKESYLQVVKELINRVTSHIGMDPDHANDS